MVLERAKRGKERAKSERENKGVSENADFSLWVH
jgi:hypothetical protein